MNLENKKQAATILLAVGFGLVAAILVGKYVQDSINQQAAKLKEDFKVQNELNRQAMQQEMVKQLTALKRQMAAEIANIKKIQGQQVIVRPSAGEVPQDPATKFSIKLPFGKRAMTVMIDSLSAVGGLINSGDFVDIIAQLNLPDTKDSKGIAQKLTSVIFQNIEVLAIGTNFSSMGSPTIYAAQQTARSLNVTLAVSAEEAGLLAFAQLNGKIQMALRPPSEKSTEVLEVASWDTLAGFVMENQGTKLDIPKKKKKTESKGKKEDVDDDDDDDDEEEDRPFIRIFKSGKETSF